MHVGYWLESQKERDHQEDRGVDGWIGVILRWILELVWFGVGTSGELLWTQ
jgi:hypothetical protein